MVESHAAGHHLYIQPLREYFVGGTGQIQGFNPSPGMVYAKDQNNYFDWSKLGRKHPHSESFLPASEQNTLLYTKLGGQKDKAVLDAFCSAEKQNCF